jgi:hypothetical protein
MFTLSSNDNRADDGHHISGRTTPPNGRNTLLTVRCATSTRAAIASCDRPFVDNRMISRRTSAGRYFQPRLINHLLVEPNPLQLNEALQ